MFLPLRNGKARWCTDKLKIQPVNRFLKELNPKYLLTGVRRAESDNRAKTIDKFRQMTEKKGINETEKITVDANNKGRLIFMPIVDFTVDDVWNYLVSIGIPWGDSMAVRTIYKEATGECGLNNPQGVENIAKQAEACGARFGCWTCPVVRTDRSTEEMTKYHAWLEPLTEWRSLHMKATGCFEPVKTEPGRLKGEALKRRKAELKKWRDINEKAKLVSRSGYMRNGKWVGEGRGCITIEVRKYLFEKLLEAEKLANRIRAMESLPPIWLISEEEKEMIVYQWKEDLEKRPYLEKNPIGLTVEWFTQLIED